MGVIERALATMPPSPGVYRMLDAKGRRALRRQGAQPEEAGDHLHPDRPPAGAAAAHGARDGLDGDRHHPHRGRGAAARSQPDQAPQAALQHRAAGRQDRYPVADADRGPPLPQIAKHRGARARKGSYYGPVRLRLGGQPDRDRDAAGVPAALLPGHGVRQPHPALPAVPDQALLGALRRPDQRGGVRPGWWRRRRRSWPARPAPCSRSWPPRWSSAAEDAGIRARRRGPRPHPRR